jgi:hypothetical protein
LFPRVESEQEVTYEDSKPNFGSASGSPEIHTETWFHIPQEELHETRRITRAYAKLLGKLPTTSELPRRKVTHVERPNTDPDFYVDSVDDLIETTLQEVPVPLSRVAHFLIEPEEEFEGEQPEITIEQLMGENMIHREVIPSMESPRSSQYGWKTS